MNPFLLIVAVLAGLVLTTAVAGRPLLRRIQKRQAQNAITQFRRQREQLEAKFFDMASRLGKPRGVRWLDCDWQERTAFGRDLQTGMLTAFVAVEIRFEAIPGGEMDGVEHVGLLRDAAALFHFQNGAWGTGGRALFNMNPADALSRLHDQYEPVEFPS